MGKVEILKLQLPISRSLGIKSSRQTNNDAGVASPLHMQKTEKLLLIASAGFGEKKKVLVHHFTSDNLTYYC